MLVYIAERLGKISWFRGMTLPSLLLMIVLAGVAWMQHGETPISDGVALGGLGVFFAAVGFLIVRMFSFDPVK